MTLAETKILFDDLSANDTDYKFLQVLASHIDLMANVAVKNIGTLAGNLVLKHDNKQFQSDLFVMLAAVGARLKIVDKYNKPTEMSMVEFLNDDLKFKVIHSIIIPKLDENSHLQTYKIMPRAQSTRALVNAGFLFKLDLDDDGKILKKPTIVFGAISEDFVHAEEAESYLIGKQLFRPEVFKTAVKILDREIKPMDEPPEPGIEYRKKLAIGLFYKYVLSLNSDLVPSKFLSGGTILSRPLSSAKQDFETDKTIWPLNKPIPKLEAVAQTAGEAQYVGDIPKLSHELSASFVLADSLGEITKMDASQALKIPGVRGFITHEDILPGRNNFNTMGYFSYVEPEEILCSGQIQYVGQPIGMILADNQGLADKAAESVIVDYKNENRKPILTIVDSLATKDPSKIKQGGGIKPTKPIGTATKVLKGTFEIGSQYHYTMETQTCLVVPTEKGLDVYPACQWMDFAQAGIAIACNIPENSINIKVRRLGGGYGAKITRPNQMIIACAIAALKLNRPVRMIMTMETNMESVGRRYAARSEYEVGVDGNGKIQYLNNSIYEDGGCSWNDSVSLFTMMHLPSYYDVGTWTVLINEVKTDTPCNTSCRAPGSLEGSALNEQIMEHIAAELDLDPWEVRMINSNGNAILRDMATQLKQDAEYDQRHAEIIQFNKDNRWKKRGMSMVPVQWDIMYLGGFYASVSIYAVDGSVAVSHGGIEMGQGINTKVAQVCAHTLGIDLAMVSVYPSDTLASPNNFCTAGSVGSESCCFAVMKSCEIIQERLKPIKEKLDPKASWTDVIRAAVVQSVDLHASYMFSNANEKLQTYGVNVVALSEVEIDVLTGQHLLRRVDIIEDCGISLSPEIDVGQIEGAFMMGVGYWTSEKLIYNMETGKLLTNRAWNYRVPGAKDIPVVFNVYLKKKLPNPAGILRSKATGEPPICVSISVFFAIKNAILAARKDAGSKDKWFQMDAPATCENIHTHTLTKPDEFKI